MMIALDVHVIGEQETGNETYTLNLARSLLRAADGRTFGLFTPHPERLPADLTTAHNAHVHEVHPANHLVRVPLALPYALKRTGARLVHVNYILPPICPCRGVVTVHDLSYEIFPDDAPPRDRLVLGTLLARSARQANAVIAVSENTRRDIVRRLHVPEERITVIYEAAPPHIRRVNDAHVRDRVHAAYGITSPYVLAVGNVQPRKNLLRVITALAALRHEGVVIQLVIAGKSRAAASEIVREVNKNGLQNDVILTGYVPDADLAALYSGALVLAYPSLYEGFGLPVLEAMTCGAPVVTSSRSSLPEVAGDAALLVDPTDAAAITDALRAVISRPDLAAQLREKGYRQAARFSWQRAAEQTLAVYDRVLAGDGAAQSAGGRT
jgi:glycosyltransferase involved in cell wall biosynthesis